ncbi:MAG: hypothetical protein J6U54_08720 [Clostridiales bacterium]|nr:hypothetical protein [Clostridiales bacterium]
MANVRMNFTGNSHKQREKRVKEPVVRGKVSTDKPKRGFWETFLEDDIDDIWEYVKEDVLKPAFKNLIFDTFAGSLERALFGSSSRSRRGGRNEITNYSGRYKYGNNSSRRDDDSRSDSSGDYKDIVYEERGDAEEVLKILRQQIEDYGKASIGDLYDASGITPPDNYSKMERYGWDDLSRASVRLAHGHHGGYYLDLPREKCITDI